MSPGALALTFCVFCIGGDSSSPSTANNHLSGLIPEHLLVEVEEHEERQEAGLVEAEKPNLKGGRIGDVHKSDLSALAELLGTVEE